MFGRKSKKNKELAHQEDLREIRHKIPRTKWNRKDWQAQFAYHHDQPSIVIFDLMLTLNEKVDKIKDELDASKEKK